MKQFDIYRNTSPKTKRQLPYYIIVQHDSYEDLHTRAIMPLVIYNKIPQWHSNIAPRVNIEFQALTFYAPMISHIDISLINSGDFICNLNTARRDIVASIDALITNT